MNLNNTEREAFRKIINILIMLLKKIEIVYHFHKERTIFAFLNRLRQGWTIKNKNKTARPTSWTPARKIQRKD